MDNPTVFWSLVISGIVVLCIGIIGYLISLWKIKKLKKSIRETQQKFDEANMTKSKTFFNDGSTAVLNRNDPGELIWDFISDLKKAKIEIIQNEEMEFLINTVIRNNYGSCLCLDSNIGYELITLAEKTPLKLYYNNVKNYQEMELYRQKYAPKKEFLPLKNELNVVFDLITITENFVDIVDQVSNSYKKLNKNGMIAIVGIKTKLSKKITKDLKKYLQLVQYRYEISLLNSNILLIVK